MCSLCNCGFLQLHLNVGAAKTHGRRWVCELCGDRVIGAYLSGRVTVNKEWLSPPIEKKTQVTKVRRLCARKARVWKV